MAENLPLPQKPTLAWAIKAPDGYIFPGFVERTRHGTIKEWDKPNWNLWRRRGYRCVRVEIREVE